MNQLDDFVISQSGIRHAGQLGCTGCARRRCRVSGDGWFDRVGDRDAGGR